MSTLPPASMLVLSVDLELDVPHRVDRARQEALATITSRLVDLLSRLQVPATWAVADPAVSAATDKVTAGSVPHEIAVLGDSTWVGKEPGRSRFGRELSRRVSGARGAGLSINTLALRDCELDGNLDLLVKHSITMLRGNSEIEHAALHSAPRGLRHGLRSFGVSLRLPAASGMMGRYLAGRRARGRLARTVAHGGLLHLLVDAPRLAESPASIKQLERILRKAVAYRQRGILEIATIAEATRRLCPSRSIQPAASILAA